MVAKATDSALLSHTVARLRLLGAAALFSTGGAAIKLCSSSNWQVASFRSAIAAIALLFLLPASRRAWNGRIVLVGCAYASTLILFVTANKLTTAANTIFLQSTAPIYILLFGPLLLRERIRQSDLAFVAVLALGLVCFFIAVDLPSASAPDPLRGNVLAASSGVMWAFTVVGLRWMGRREQEDAGSGAACVVAGNVIAFLVCLPLALPVVDSQIHNWLVVGYLGVFQIGVAYVLLIAAVRDVSALEASLLLLLEPALNPFWAWLVLGETPGTWALGGGGIILVATGMRAWLDLRRLGTTTEPPTP